MLRQHAQPHSSTSEHLPSPLSDIHFSLRPSSGIEICFTINSYPRSTHLIGNPQSVSSLSAIDAAGLPYHTLEEKFRPPTHDPYPYPLRLDNQKLKHARQNLRHHIVPVNRTNNSLQDTTITRNWELNRLTEATKLLQI